MTQAAIAKSLESSLGCRPIGHEHLAAVEACLVRHFPERSANFWRNALIRLSERDLVDDLPRYGFCLANGSEVVGVLLLIHSTRGEGADRRIFCHFSSWCVDEAYRFMAPMLSIASTRRKDVTYVNISPAIHTRRAIEALGYRRYERGQMIFAPLLSLPRRGVRIAPFAPNTPAASALPKGEREILMDHQAFGCRAFIGVSGDAWHGFVTTQARVLRERAPCERILYCRDLETLSRFGGAIGAYLAKCGTFVCLVDADEKIPGLVGRFVADREPKYFKGPEAPRLGDLAYSEVALFQEPRTLAKGRGKSC